jgi:hypothetical protein
MLDSRVFFKENIQRKWKLMARWLEFFFLQKYQGTLNELLICETFYQFKKKTSILKCL